MLRMAPTLVLRTPRQIMRHEMVRSAICFALISATNRKCWHIVSTAPHTPNTQRTSARSAPGLTVRSKHQVSESGRAAVTQQTTVGSTAGQTAQRGRPPLSESDQAALFLEFLRWKEQQGTANSHAIEPPRRTVNP